MTSIKKCVFRSSDFQEWTAFSPIISQLFHKINKKWTDFGSYFLFIMNMERCGIVEQKIKQDTYGTIGLNIRRLRLSKGIGQIELVRMMNLQGIPITRECLGKIERGVQHVQLQQLRAIKDSLDTTYDKLLD